MNFVDQVEVTFQAGRGGNGALSFHHEKFRAKGGPDGGDGGRGGDVILQASRNQNTLANFRYKKLLKAEPGQPGRDSKKHGRSGPNLLVKVPVGTVVLGSSGEVLADLTDDGQETIIAHGGRGGFGNAHFTSSRRQAPRLAELGEPGDKLPAVLELKMIADAGLVGLPNAGKSTLLSVISNAKPAVADYPFTTMHPYLGVVDIDGQRSLLVADIPGLIAGASQGKGLGDEFLRHVERTSVLIHLIDAYHEDIVKAYKTIMQELKDYKIDLSKKPQVVALTKTEGLTTAETNKLLKKLQPKIPRGTPLLAISAASRAGVDELLRTTLKLVDKAKKQPAKKTPTELPIIGLKPEDDWRIEKTDDGYLITGPKLESFARRTVFGDFHHEQRLRDILARWGIVRELQKQGIVPGQIVIIGQPEIGRLQY